MSTPAAGLRGLFSIPSTASFADALASGALAAWGDAPMGLARATILLPNRRACRAMQEAFLRSAAGRAVILPRLVPLGDIDSEELALGDAGEECGAPADASTVAPAMPALRRQLLLARLILKWGESDARHGGGHPPSEDQALHLAAELARLLDQVETEGLDFTRLADLVPERYAEHWQKTLRFLEIVTDAWPRVEAEEDTTGPAERRHRLAMVQVEAWRKSPPSDPILVAGSTGSIPATAELIRVVADLPGGAVVLPGLDQEAPEDIWAAILDDPTHPQHGLARLLAFLGRRRDEVAAWPCAPASADAARRSAFAAVALRPAGTTGTWRGYAQETDAATVATGLEGVRRIDCPGPGEEAAVIALLLRHSLETPEKRAALVTPDRGLARRVSSELARWNIAIDDSAGVPLADTAPGTFLKLLAEAVAADLAPLPLLALLKHPLAAGGLEPGTFRRQVRALEMAVLRGPRPAPGLAGLQSAVDGDDRALHDWLAATGAALRPLLESLSAPRTPLADIVAHHVDCAESLAATAAESGDARLWAGEAGEAAAAFLRDLLDGAAAWPPLPGRRYPAVFNALLAGQVVRPRYGRHPRLAILGPLEARLQHFDVMVLGGLNEGTWPGESDPGPWLSRPMQRDFGLPAAERRIGQAAHDFTQALAAPQVFLTRATRVEGAPTVPSRWLLRLETLCQGLGLGDPLSPGATQWLDWAGALDAAERGPPGSPPEPRPPLTARPRSLSVTRIETWMRDPYGLYAEKILGLKALDPIDADPGAAERGTLIHTILERFLKKHAGDWPADPEAALLAVGREAFRPFESNPGVYAFWWPRFRRIAAWFAAAESARRGGLAASHVEISGRLQLAGPGGPFELTAKADRIDRQADGSLVILDYKTGAPPSHADLQSGLAPQLPLEAAMARDGGFPGLAAGKIDRLEYWRLSGGVPAGETTQLKGDPTVLAATAVSGLEALIARFDDPATPYLSQPRPKAAPRFSDYRHLARVKEWGGAQSEDGEGGEPT